MNSVWDTLARELSAQPLFIKIILIMLVAYFIATVGSLMLGSAIRRSVVQLKTDKHQDDLVKRQETLVSIFGALFAAAVWFVAVIVILQTAGVNLAALLAGVSVLGVALGFGTQSLVKDVLAGTFVILENQYRVGDVVNLDGSEGQVEHISLRSTALRDADGSMHRIPNGSVARVVNKTMGFSNVNLTVAVPADTNLNKVTKLINTVGQELAESKKWQTAIIEPPSYTTIGALTGGSLEVKITGKTQPSQQWPVSAELRKRLVGAFKEAGVEVSEIS